MTVLVTGAAGFIGGQVCRELISRGMDVRAVDCFLPDSYSAAIKRRNWERLASLPRLEQIELDLRDPLPAMLMDGVTSVVNEAAMPGLMKSWTDFRLYIRCNVELVENLASACVSSGVPHLIQISTSSVYGEDARCDEAGPTNPISPYGVTKLAAEELIRAYHRTFGLPFTILRYFSVYGPGQRPDMAYHRIIKSIMRDEPIDVFGDGEQTRSNTYVDDCARATVEAVIRRPFGHTVNIAGAESNSLLRAIDFIEEALGRGAKLRFHPARPGDQRHTAGTTSLARSLLDFNPVTTLREGLAEQVRWQVGLEADGVDLR
jgi:nucleoside-diphosphate-sugar epimerase